jgi:N-carbamoylputrescine amidase
MAEEPGENLAKALAYLERAADEGAHLVLFPESQLSPYFPQFPNRDASRYRVGLEDPLVEQLRQACRARRILATANLYLAEATGNYSATVMIGRSGEILGVSRKMHITCVPSFYEQHYFAPSGEGFHVYDTSIGRIGVVICYDRHYPESIRSCALRSAELILIPTANTTAETMEMFDWEVRVAAFQNNVYLAMCNRVGIEDAMSFAGQSLVVDPDGEVVARVGSEEQLLMAEIDLGRVQASRRERPYLALRNPRLSVLLQEM